jgi:hypothetical protein
MKREILTKEFVKTKHGLARRLEISRNTLDKFLGMPGAPEPMPGRGWPLADVVDFVSSHATNARTLAATDPNIRELKAYELGLKCARLRFYIERERGGFVNRNDLCASIHRVASGMRAKLWQRLMNEYPVVVSGLEAPQIREKMDVFFNELMRDIKSLGDEFNGIRDANATLPLPEAPASVPSTPQE